MSIYSDKACEYFKEGYNCAQAVLMAFDSVTGFDKETSLKLASSFGGGMGRLREVCGALSSAFMIAGMLRGYISPADDEAKANHYQLIQDIAGEFKKANGSMLCRELLGLEECKDSPIPSVRTEKYYNERPCEKIIKTAAQIVEQELLN